MKPIITLLALLWFPLAYGQSANQAIRQGYRAFIEGRHTEAAQWFQKANEMEPGSYIPLFNEGGAWYEQDSLTRAQEAFQTALARATDATEKAAAYHNLGNVLLKNQQYQESIDAFREALLNNPYDEDTRYNLAYAMSKLPPKDQQQQQQDQQEQEDNQDQEQKKDQQQQENDDRQEEQQQDNKEQQASSQPQMSPQQMEQLLKALEQEEQKIQQRLAKKEAGTPTKKEKDW